MAVAGGPLLNSIETCLDACQANGYALAGVEYAAECVPLFSFFLSQF